VIPAVHFSETETSGNANQAQGRLFDSDKHAI